MSKYAKPFNDSEEQIQPSAASKPKSKYADSIKKVADQRQLLLNRALKRSLGNPPDEIASILGLSRNTGLSPELVRSNKEDVEYRVKQREIGAQVASLSQPGQEWLTEKYNLDISQDDLANIKAMDDAITNKSWYEKDFLDKLMDSSVKTGTINVRQMASSIEATPGMNRIPEFDRIDELLAEGDREAALSYIRENDRALAGTALKADLLRYIGAEPEDRAELRAMSMEQISRSASQIAQQESERRAIPNDPGLTRAMEDGSASAVLGAIADDPGIIPRVTVESLITSAPSLAAGVFGTMSGALPAAAGSAMASYGTERGLGLISALRDAGVDTSDPDQLIAAMTDPSILEDAQRRAELKALPISMLDMLGAGLASRLLAPTSVAGKTLTTRQREAINLFTQMPVQGIQEGAGEASGQYLADGEVNTAEVALETIAGAFGSTSDVLAFSGNRVFESVVNNANSYRRAKKDRAYLTAVKDAANQTQLRKRDPQALKELLNRLSQTGPVDEIYISGKDFQELFQSKNLDPEEYAQKMESVGQQYHESLLTGGDIAVSVADFAAVIAPTEAAEDFILRARTKTDGMSPAEADQWMNEQARPTLEAIINYDGDQAGQSAQKVFDDVVGQLLATGMDQQTAERNASLYRAFFDVMGQTEEVDPYDLYQQYNLAITREMPEILKRRDNNVDALDPLLDRLRSGDVPSQQSIFGASLTDFLREQGGVQDYAGELSAMDADKSRQAFQRKLVNEQGLDLATAAERAAEAGYIESRDTNQLLAALDTELRGEPVYSKGGEDAKLQETAADLMALQEELDRLGIDLAEVDNATAKEALNSVVYGDAQQGAEVELDQNSDALQADGAGFRFVNPVALTDGGRISGFTDQSQDVLFGYDSNGELYSVRADRFDPAKIDERQARGDRSADRLRSMLRRKQGETVELNQFAGINARTADQESLILARKLAKDGQSAEVIRRRTGWHRGPDGLWRYEISDDQAKLRSGWEDKIAQGGVIKLGQMLNHSKLYAAYPELVRVDVTFLPEGDEANGMWSPKQREIAVNIALEEDELISVLMHEIQHAIQDIEDFGRGGAPQTNFTESVKNALKQLEKDAAGDRDAWEWVHRADIKNADKAAEVARNGLMYESAKRLIEYSHRDSPSGVFRLIRNEMQWIYGVRGDSVANDLQRMFWDIPKRHKKQERNAFIADMAMKASLWLREQIPADQWSQFESDSRTIKGMLNALSREARKANDKLSPLRDLKRQEKAAKTVTESARFKSPYDIYRALAGEIEARNTQARLNFNDEQRKNQSPQSTADVAAEDAIVIVGGMQVQAPESFYSVGSAYGQDIGGKRGVIRIDRTNRNFNIELLAKADLSTFLHESGHFFLEVLGDLSQREGASDRVKSQYQTLLDWFEVESRDQIGVEQHEQFARGFEAYLMEGKAPTPELQSVFARFRAWLLAVYKRLTALNVDLTDEVRNVMDRILATDEEIERARGEAGMTDSLSDIATMGWTDKERADYRDLIDEAKEAAKSELVARQMKDLRKTEKDWYKQERAKVRDEVLKEMNQNRVYRALAHLQNGKLPDGSELPDGVQPVKLNKQELLDDYGKEFLKRLPNPKNELVGGPYVYTREGGVPAQSVAELYGFSSGDELVQALANARPMKELIEAETDARMRNLYPDINVSGEAAEAAIAAVHNDKAAERMLMELKKLHSKSRFSGKPMAPAKLLRETAERLVRGQAIKSIRPDLYRRAESRAANDAFTEATNNDFDSAFESKQRQLLNHYMYREAVKAREEAEQVYNYVKTFNKKTTRQTIGKAGSDYLERIDEIIDQFEFRRVSIRQLGRRESLRSWMEKQNNDNAPVDIPDYVLDQAQRVNYRDISVEELAAVKDAIANLEHVARLKTRLIKDAKGREVKQAREEIAATIRDNANRKVKSAIESHLPSENRKYMLADYLASHRRLSSLIREMDGQRDGGTVWELIMKPINEAGDQEANMILESNEKLHELFKQYSPLELRRFMKKQYIPAINDSLTKQGAIMVALNTGTEDNLQKLKDGYGWSDSQVQSILSTLEKKDWDFIQGVWDHINSYWPLIEAKEKRVKGVAPEKVEARQVLTEYGPYRGGYFPLKYDERQEADAYADRIKDMADMAMKGAFSSSTTRRGHTKERVKGVERKVKLDFGVVFQHLTEVVHDLTHHEMLIDVSRLMKGSDVKDAIVESFGMPTYTTIDNAITDIAAGDVPAVRAHERALQHLRNGVTIAGMGWNIGTALLQPLGITNSIVRIGPKWVGQGIKRWMSSAKNMEGITAWITEVSPFMKNRFTTQNREINDVRNKMKGKGRLSWIEDSYFWMITTMQKVVDIPTWLGAYEKALSEGAMETDAYRMADQAVIDAQGGGQIKDLAQIQRGHPALKLFTNFISYFVTTWNLMAESGRRTNFKHPAEVGRFASDFLLLYTIPAILGWLVKGSVRGFDDDDREDPMKALAAEQLSFMAGGFFGLREFTSAISGFYGYSGPAGTRFFSEGSSIITQAQQGEVDRALLKSMNDTAGILFHYPSGQVQRTTEGFISILEGETQNPGALLLGPPKD